MSTISLTLHASAQILPSDGSSPANPSHIERQLRSNDLWISQTPELNFIVSIPDTVLGYNDIIHPPSSIPSVLLSSIKVSLSFAHNEEHAQVYIPTSMAKPEIPEDQYRTGYISILPYDEHKQDMLLFGLEQKKPEDSEDTETPTFIEELEELHGSEQSSSLLTSHHTTFGRVSPDTRHKELYNLITTGLESLLLGCSEGSYQSEKGLQSLPQLAPSVFSPGYYREMSQRSQLIPPIAKSISSMLKLPSYQPLIPKLNYLNASSAIQSFPASPTNTRNTIKAALWRIAQKQLYKPQASQNLRLLTPRPLPKSRTRNHPQRWKDDIYIGGPVAPMYNDNIRDKEFSPNVDEDLLGFSEPDETSCEMLSTAFSSSSGSLQFSLGDDDNNGDVDLLPEQLEEDISSQTPFSDDLAFDGESENDDDDMLCDYI
ncbi:hypothetical protein BO94DRAFT_460289 [Aspergillus sclerotioniger CBS 115572]|uniref:Uncharacterized protein n=1 Tax=Aspergillus sclerotioniger CBS 115572 TaxID=1450535 RepID=A0A317X564_9EURO|nr:hypothetical protein BO94DRAFT_460289 [Aspergillus sclerotioniger CBS 115572]PWY93719.1 hypothetical protein BO94DRAFT_460289 [Aspergillus sclerotioniger CBS 115572]